LAVADQCQQNIYPGQEGKVAQGIEFGGDGLDCRDVLVMVALVDDEM
jgi:hypothetical protein